MKNLLIIALSLISISLFGQKFNYHVPVDDVSNTGFVKISLKPEITSKLKTDFSDIRIYDTNRTEVPYIFFKEPRVLEKDLFVPYEIIEKEHNKKYAYTRIIIHNPKRNKINNIVLRVKNADVRKRLKLNASNDQKNWYALKDNYYYNSIRSGANISEIRVLNFPWSDYEYYELLIGDYYDRPINILEAGYYNHVKEDGKYTELKHFGFAINDTLKQSIISIPLNNNYLDKISFTIDTPKYYHRSADIYIHEIRTYKRKKTIYKKTIARIELVSNSSNVFNLNNLKADTLFVRIHNDDNPVLYIGDIQLFQLNKYLIADLNQGNHYQLYYSDKKAEKPIYDLEYFSDSIQENLSVVSCGMPIRIKAESKEKDGNFNLNDYWLWIIIIGVAVLLAYMSYGMIKDRQA